MKHIFTFLVTQSNIIERKSLEILERIAKEGRKNGVGTLVVSQRPSDVNTKILSQGNNILSLRLTKERDKFVVKNYYLIH
jgi:DNA helicase HerA-like ATPase